MGSAGLPKAFTFENPYSADYQTTKNLEINGTKISSSLKSLDYLT